MTQITIQKLFDDTREKLDLEWIAGKGGGDRKLTGDSALQPGLALIGHLNFIHPNRIQLLGLAEMAYLRGLDGAGLERAINTLFSPELTAIVVASGEHAPEVLLERADRDSVPVLAGPQKCPEMLRLLRHYLAQTLADRVSVHGVFLEVLGMGVMITGDSAIGKSELALELITRGHRLIADDMVDLLQVSPDMVEGYCPPVLQGFLEVRGLGILDIRALFGEVAVKLQKNLKLIVHLKKPIASGTSELDRLQMYASTETILGVPIPKVHIPVAAGRNLAVLVEVAVRNHILRLRGIDGSKTFSERQQQHILDSE